MERIEKVCSLESKLVLIPIYSIWLLDIFEVIEKTRFRKIAKCKTLFELSLPIPLWQENYRGKKRRFEMPEDTEMETGTMNDE